MPRQRSKRNAAAATQMRGTTQHITSVMVPVAQTAARNAAAAQSAAISTQQLALGSGEIDSTARALRDQALQLDELVCRFTFEQSLTRAPREAKPTREAAEPLAGSRRRKSLGAGVNAAGGSLAAAGLR